MSARQVNVEHGKRGFQPARTSAENRPSAPPPTPPADPGWMTVSDAVGSPRTCLTDPTTVEWAADLRLGSLDGTGRFVLDHVLDPVQVIDCFRRQVSDEEWAAMPAGTRLLHPSSIRRWHRYDTAAAFTVEFVAYRDGQIDYRELGGTAMFTLPAEARHTTRLAVR